MSKQFISQDFEQAYNKVFGNDRDLSELSDIDLDDFKEVMKVAIEQFDNTAPPEPEECRDIIYIFWRVYKTVYLLLINFSLENTIDIIKRENFYELNNKETIVQAISDENPLLSNRYVNIFEMSLRQY